MRDTRSDNNDNIRKTRRERSRKRSSINAAKSVDNDKRGMIISVSFLLREVAFIVK